MPIPLIELIERVPPETRSVVDQTRQRFNRVLRRTLYDETRLQFHRGANADPDEFYEGRTVLTYVSDGYPAGWLNLSFDEGAWLAIALAPHVSLLETARSTAEELLPNVAGLANRSQFRERFPDAGRTVASMADLTEALLHEAAKFDLLERILAFDEDVLGLYSCRGGNAPSARIDLYWCPIGLVAKLLGVSAEALTIVVLAHELAHAYTHIGVDANGLRWSDGAFLNSELGLTEGLAQYFAARVVERLEGQIAEAKVAYERLLPRQPEPYRTHLQWAGQFSPEEVRDALLAVRRARSGTVEAFNNALDEASQRQRR